MNEIFDNDNIIIKKHLKKSNYLENICKKCDIYWENFKQIPKLLFDQYKEQQTEFQRLYSLFFFKKKNWSLIRENNLNNLNNLYNHSSLDINSKYCINEVCV